MARMASCSWRTAAPVDPWRSPTTEPGAAAAVGAAAAAAGAAAAGPDTGRRDAPGQPEIASRVLGDDPGRVETVLLLEHAQGGGGPGPEVAVGAAGDVVAEADQLLLDGLDGRPGVALAQPDDRCRRSCADVGADAPATASVDVPTNAERAGAHDGKAETAGAPGRRRDEKWLSFQSCLSDRMDSSPFDQNGEAPERRRCARPPEPLGGTATEQGTTAVERESRLVSSAPADLT